MDSINAYKDEKVLVIENKDLAAWRRVSDNDTKALINAVQHHGFFKDRPLVESDTELKQVIPYIVLECDGKYLVTKRIKGDERLLNQYSIGVGGHINLDDYVKGAGAIEVIDFQATITNCVERELAEETTYEGDCHFKAIGAFTDDKEEKLNLYQLANKVIFDGLTYISTYSVEAFKQLVNCKKLYVKVSPNANQLFFTYGCNIGFVAVTGVPNEPVIAIVANSCGKVFPLLMEKVDVGKTTLPIAKVTPKKVTPKAYSHKTSFGDYEEERMSDADNWSDPYGDEQAYYDNWSREEVDNDLADAYEGDLDVR